MIWVRLFGFFSSVFVSVCLCVFFPRAESFGVSAQVGSAVVWGGPEVRFHEGSTRVPPGFHEGSMRFCEGCGVVRALKSAPLLLGISPELTFFFRVFENEGVYLGASPFRSAPFFGGPPNKIVVSCWFSLDNTKSGVPSKADTLIWVSIRGDDMPSASRGRGGGCCSRGRPVSLK